LGGGGGGGGGGLGTSGRFRHRCREKTFSPFKLKVNSLMEEINRKGGPEPLEKVIHEILGSKREDQFSRSQPFFRTDTKNGSGSVFVPASAR